MTDWFELAKDAICRSGTELTPSLVADVGRAMQAVAMIARKDPEASRNITNGDVVRVLSALQEKPVPKVYSHTLEPHGEGGWKLTYYIDGEYSGAASYEAGEQTYDHLVRTGQEWDRINTIKPRTVS